MGVPVLRQGRLLIASVPSTATDSDLQSLLSDLGDAVGSAGALGIVVDVSALDVLDSFATRVLETVGDVARLRGAETVIVGIRPAVAIAMVQLGATLASVGTALDLEDGIALLKDRDVRLDERPAAPGEVASRHGPDHD